jgi:hypothetical protein
MNIFQRNVLAALACLGATAAAAQGTMTPAKISALDRLYRTEHDIVASAPWPSAGPSIGFKTLVLGDDFDLDGSYTYSYALKDQEGGYMLDLLRGDGIGVGQYKLKPAKCRLTIISAVNFECELTKGYPPENVDLNTAFGESVKVTIEVIPRTVITWDALQRRRFGVGRIEEIHIVATNPTPQFADRAIEHFTRLMGAAPMVVNQTQGADPVMSQDCVNAMQRIKKKPASSLTQEDHQTQTECGIQATNGLMAQKGKEETATVKYWKTADKLVTIAVASTEVRSTVSIAGMTPPVSRTVEISLVHNTTDGQTRQLKQALTDFVHELSNDPHASSDF